MIVKSAGPTVDVLPVLVVLLVMVLVVPVPVVVLVAVAARITRLNVVP